MADPQLSASALTKRTDPERCYFALRRITLTLSWRITLTLIRPTTRGLHFAKERDGALCRANASTVSLARG